MALRKLSALLLALVASGAVQAQDIASTKPGDPAAGDDVFIKCSGCHQVGPGAENGIGPELNGLAGRAPGSVPGYDYSSALKDAKVHWNHDELAAFVTDAKGLVPGTKMSFAGLKSAQDVEDLIAYLNQFDREGRTR